MPTYEYECVKCKKRFDLFQKITAKPITKCKYCGGKVDRLIGAGSGIIFKGSGFYATDYKNKGQKDKDRKNNPPPCPAKGASCSSCPLGEQ